MIAVVDYGMGNLRNVRRAVEECGGEVLVTPDPREVARAERIILPGVGAFGEAAARIERLGLRQPLLQAMGRGVPLLGICLGMQLLYRESEESPGAVGLGILTGVVRRFGKGLKVPHIGWNDVSPVGQSPLFPEGKGGVFYFVHSYYLPDSPDAIATTSYGTEWVSAGMKLLRGFLAYGGEKR
jgi:imidazole glycerol phosphate synthase glutamine amidotransferase subunit